MCEWMEKNGIGSCGLVRILSAVLTAALMVIASSAPSMAQTADRVYKDCKFSLSDLQTVLKPTSGSSLPFNLEAVTVVVYANNRNFGQAILDSNQQPTGEYTGRVVCTSDAINPDAVELKAETDPIPANSSDTVDIHDLGQGMALRYTVNPGGTPGIQVCATSNGNGDCVRAPLQ